MAQTYQQFELRYQGIISLSKKILKMIHALFNHEIDIGFYSS